MSEVNRTVGEKIRALREARGWLQRELAHNACVPVRTIGRIERGEVDVRLSTLGKIARALDVSVKEFL
jgi:transcriptional regulator with XRE-family HTH domain